MNSIIENDSRQTHPDWESLGTTPVGLGNSLTVFPRVAEYSNPGLADGIPFGENCSNSTPNP
jgi:hypothetical protein